MNHLRLIAEHEAAHAVTAAHFGQVLRSIRIGPTAGETRYVGTCTPAEEAVICAAGDLFNRELGTVPYVDYGCADLADFEREHGLGRLWGAQRSARAILTARRTLVLDLAARLVHDRVLRWSEPRSRAA